MKGRVHSTFKTKYKKKERLYSETSGYFIKELSDDEKVGQLFFSAIGNSLEFPITQKRHILCFVYRKSKQARQKG